MKETILKNKNIILVSLLIFSVAIILGIFTLTYVLKNKPVTEHHHEDTNMSSSIQNHLDTYPNSNLSTLDSYSKEALFNKLFVENSYLTEPAELEKEELVWENDNYSIWFWAVDENQVLTTEGFKVHESFHVQKQRQESQSLNYDIVAASNKKTIVIEKDNEYRSLTSEDILEITGATTIEEINDFLLLNYKLLNVNSDITGNKMIMTDQTPLIFSEEYIFNNFDDEDDLFNCEDEVTLNLQTKYDLENRTVTIFTHSSGFTSNDQLNELTITLKVGQESRVIDFNRVLNCGLEIIC